jgi:hypothetical protein
MNLHNCLLLPKFHAQCGSEQHHGTIHWDLEPRNHDDIREFGERAAWELHSENVDLKDDPVGLANYLKVGCY